MVECGAGRERFEVGDRVMAVVGGGGQAELAVATSGRDAGAGRARLDAAGGVPEVFTTAHDALFTQAGLIAGERLLVHGGAGGVGIAAVQLGVMAGARVTATVRDEQRASRSTRSAPARSSRRSFEEQGPFDVVLELVGAPNLPATWALATGGRIAVIGIGAGAKAELDLRR